MADDLTDPSRSTEQFRAFVQGTSGEPDHGWAARTPWGKVLLLAAVVLGVAIVIAVISLAMT